MVKQERDHVLKVRSNMILIRLAFNIYYFTYGLLGIHALRTSRKYTCKFVYKMIKSQREVSILAIKQLRVPPLLHSHT